MKRRRRDPENATHAAGTVKKRSLFKNTRGAIVSADYFIVLVFGVIAGVLTISGVGSKVVNLGKTVAGDVQGTINANGFDPKTPTPVSAASTGSTVSGPGTPSAPGSGTPVSQEAYYAEPDPTN